MLNRIIAKNCISVVDRTNFLPNENRAVIEKESGLFIGWSGFKYYKDGVNNHSNYYDLGYRFIPEYWGKGYATETCVAWMKYGFENFNKNE